MVNVGAQVEAAVASTGQSGALGSLDLFASNPLSTGEVSEELIGLFQAMLSQQTTLGNVTPLTVGDTSPSLSSTHADESEHDVLTEKFIPSRPDSPGPETMSWAALLVTGQPTPPRALPEVPADNDNGSISEGEVDDATHLTGPRPLEGRGLENALLRVTKSSEQAQSILSKLTQSHEPQEISPRAFVSMNGQRSQAAFPPQGEPKGIALQSTSQNAADPVAELVHVNQFSGEEPVPAPPSELPQAAEARGNEAGPVAKTVSPATAPQADPVTQTVTPATAAPQADPVTQTVTPAAAPQADPVTQAVTPAAASKADPVTQTVTPAAAPQADPVTATVPSATAPKADPVTQTVTPAAASKADPVTATVTPAAASKADPVTETVTPATASKADPVTATVPSATASRVDPVTETATPATASKIDPVTATVPSATAPQADQVTQTVAPATAPQADPVTQTVTPAATLQANSRTAVSRETPVSGSLEIPSTLPVGGAGNEHEVAPTGRAAITPSATSPNGVVTVGTHPSQPKEEATTTLPGLPSTDGKGEVTTETSAPVEAPKAAANQTPQTPADATQSATRASKTNAQYEGGKPSVERQPTVETRHIHRAGSTEQVTEQGQTQKNKWTPDTSAAATPPVRDADIAPLRVTVPTPPSQGDTLPSGQVLVNDLVSRIQVAVARGVSKWRMKLNPPSLGPLDVSLSMKEDTLTVHLTTATQSVRGLIEANLNELRHNLSERGLQLGSLNINVASENSSGLNFAFGEPRPWQDFSNAPWATNPPPGGEESSKHIPTNVTPRLQNAEGRIDVLV